MDPTTDIDVVFSAIRRLERAYQNLPSTMRTPQFRRGLAVEVLRSIEHVLQSFELQSTMLNEVIVALLETDDGARAELFKIAKDEEGRSRLDRSRRTTEAQAAAMLEFAVECGEQEKKWAQKISDALDASGFQSVRCSEKKPFCPTSVIQWRRLCAEGRHPSADFYRRLVDQSKKANIDPLTLLDDYVRCWCSFFGSTKSSNKKEKTVFWTAVSELREANTAFIPLPAKRN